MSGREESFLDDVLCCVDLLRSGDTNEFSGFGFAMGKSQKEQIKKFAKKIVLCPVMTESPRKLAKPSEKSGQSEENDCVVRSKYGFI